VSKRQIYKDSAYPVYGLVVTDDNARDIIDVPDDLINRYEAAEAAYNAVQDELEVLFNGYRRN
jgi:hypothetical protein